MSSTLFFFFEFDRASPSTQITTPQRYNTVFHLIRSRCVCLNGGPDVSRRMCSLTYRNRTFSRPFPPAIATVMGGTNRVTYCQAQVVQCISEKRSYAKQHGSSDPRKRTRPSSENLVVLSLFPSRPRFFSFFLELADLRHMETTGDWT